MFFLSPLLAEKFLPKAYNSFAGDFSQTRQNKWTEFDELAKENYEKNIDEIQKSGEYRVLDIGCGNGRLRKFLEEKKFSGEYFARDISENFLNHARENLKDISEQKNIHFSIGGFLDIIPKFSENFFDEVWTIASFHHLSQHKDREKALRNIAKILKPNGKIILTVWNLWEQEKYQKQKKEAYFRSIANPLFSNRDFLIPWGIQKIPRYYYSFSKKYLKNLLEEAGFEIEKIFYSDQKRNICIRAQKKEKNPEDFEKFFIKNIPFHKISEEETLKILKKWESSPQKNLKKIYTPNPEMIGECEKNSLFKSVLQKADLSLADGNGILWACGLPNLEGKFFLWKWIFLFFSLFHYGFFRNSFPKKISHPVCGSDIFQKFLEQTTQNNTTTHHATKIFLLGGEKGSAEYIQKKFSAIVEIFDEKVNERSIPTILEKIILSKATVLFVALGAPKQEIFIDRFSTYLEKNSHIRIAMGVGGSFDFVSGHQKRAPKIFRNLGIEWIYRLIKSPERAKRIWNATGKFIEIIGK